MNKWTCRRYSTFPAYQQKDVLSHWSNCRFRRSKKLDRVIQGIECYIEGRDLKKVLMFLQLILLNTVNRAKTCPREDVTPSKKKKNWEVAILGRWIAGKGQAEATADLNVSTQLPLCPLFSRHKYVFIIIQNQNIINVVIMINADTWKNSIHSNSPEAETREDEISDCRCITCSAAIKSGTIRGKVVTMETGFVWKVHAMRHVCPCKHWSSRPTETKTAGVSFNSPLD